MAKKASPKTARPAARKKKTRTTPRDDVFDRSDLRRMVLELAVQVAPTDIDYALANGPQILRRADQPGSHLNPAQIKLAIALLTDYRDGECDQVPLHAITLVAAALQYLGDQIDLVPDFLPKVGDLDDAAVFAVAMSMARPGVLRYCAASGRRLKA